MSRHRAVIVRPTEDDDLEGIASLFRERREIPALRWVLSDPHEPGHLRSWVAVDGGKIVGHAGYVTSEFGCGTSTLTGSAAIDWIVRPDYQGTGVGGELYRHSFGQADFEFIIGGTAASNRAFPRLGYHHLFDVAYFVKILDPARYVMNGRGRLRRLAKAGLLAWTSCPGRRPREASAASLIELGADAYRESDRPAGYNVNTLPPWHLAWALGCPTLDARAFHVAIGDRVAGTALCYVNGRCRGPRTARLTHLTYLGDETGTWRSAIAAIEGMLRADGATMVSALACHPAFVTALEDRGFVARGHLPFWLRDPRGVVPRRGWHLTAIESDIGHRGV